MGSGFALNAAGQFKTNKKGTLSLYYYDAYSLTPRWENDMFSLELPLSYNELTQFNAGLSFRAGPFFIGSGSVLSALVHDSKQADLHVGFHFGIKYKKKIKPDGDKDGVYDDVDKCPGMAGLARYGGCPIPDTDGDGVNDEEDSCKTVTGMKRYNGCPIPDGDGDGVNDEEDSCKDVAGLKKFNGCPDTDGDGIMDKEDKCPTVTGVAKYNGCPVPDTDKDGVPDDEDLCPNEAGPVASKGCPVEKVVVQITADFKNILFDYGKATIRGESGSILSKAAETMNKQIGNSNFYIDGYTDSKGSVAYNKKLSKARAQAVANALIANGIDKSRIVVRGFGKDNPICDNKTEEGRQCNRRVEVVIRNVNQKEEQRSIKVNP
jgi:outer membrane protein OmpA-like peptidoglycan-associated protein